MSHSSQSSTSTDGSQQDSPVFISTTWTDYDVRDKSRTLEKAIKGARDESVTGVKAFFFGSKCTRVIQICVPAITESMPTALETLRPQVWMAHNWGNDWQGEPSSKNWTQTVVREIRGTRLTRGYVFFTEVEPVGITNPVLYQATNGQICMGNVIVARLTEDDEFVDDMEDEDITLAIQAFHGAISTGRIRQGKITLAPRKK